MTESINIAGMSGSIGNLKKQCVVSVSFSCESF